MQNLIGVVVAVFAVVVGGGWLVYRQWFTAPSDRQGSVPVDDILEVLYNGPADAINTTREIRLPHRRPPGQHRHAAERWPWPQIRAALLTESRLLVHRQLTRDATTGISFWRGEPPQFGWRESRQLAPIQGWQS